MAHHTDCRWLGYCTVYHTLLLPGRDFLEALLTYSPSHDQNHPQIHASRPFQAPFIPNIPPKCLFCTILTPVPLQSQYRSTKTPAIALAVSLRRHRCLGGYLSHCLLHRSLASQSASLRPLRRSQTLRHCDPAPLAASQLTARSLCSQWSWRQRARRAPQSSRHAPGLRT